MKILYDDGLEKLTLGRTDRGFYELRFETALQFNHEDEYRYHQVLFGLPILLHPSPKRVLILGGGDGLGLREVLRFEEVERVVLVDISEEVVFFAKTNPVWRRLNKDAFRDARVEVVIADGFEWVKREGEKFDVIIADYPDPKVGGEHQVNRLFTIEHYTDIANRLTEGGLFSAQSTSVWISPNVFRKLLLNLSKVFRTVVPLRVNTRHFTDVGITLSSLTELKELKFHREPPKEYFYDASNLPAFFYPLNDERATLPDEVIEELAISDLAYYDVMELPYKRIIEKYEEVIPPKG